MDVPHDGCVVGRCGGHMVGKRGRMRNKGRTDRGPDGGRMADGWWTDGGRMVDGWWTDGRRMMDGWWTDGGRMVDGW